uniref:class I SAM-dependent methyltransferase n=1 Tax=Polynucleobacter sp. TaxID=2029855 RepID=UPI0040486E5E
MNNRHIFEGCGIPLFGGRRKAFNDFNEMVFSGKIKIESVEFCFCGRSDFELLSRLDRFGLPFGTKICTSCGLVTQTRRISSESLPTFYEKIYWPLISGLDEFLTLPKKGETLSYLLKHIRASDKEIRLFEVGCGSGMRISKLRDELVQESHKVIAIACDYSTQALYLAKQKDIRVIHGGMNELRVEGKADILILSHVFEHFPNLAEAIAQIENLIHDDTIIYIEVPGIEDLENKYEYLFDYQMYCVLAHTYNFSLTTLSNVMATRDFVLLEGDEYIRAVFKKGSTNEQRISGYKRIIDGLNRAEIKRRATEKRRNQWIVKYLRGVAKALLNREA